MSRITTPEQRLSAIHRFKRSIYFFTMKCGEGTVHSEKSGTVKFTYDSDGIITSSEGEISKSAATIIRAAINPKNPKRDTFLP